MRSLAGPHRTLAELAPDDHVAGFAQDIAALRLAWGIRAKLSVILAEPKAIHARYHRRLARAARHFHRVLTYDADLLARLPNAIFFPYGTSWVSNWRQRDLSKRAMCSLIASAKRSQPGHVLRHALAEKVRREGHDVAVIGRGYAAFADKADGLAPYRYSVVIENTRERNYFTEKLVDAILCQTVPIYWGCPNIGDFMDTSGMILCESETDIHAALDLMSPDDYRARLPNLIAARPVAEAYGDLFMRAAQVLLGDAPVPPSPECP